MENYEKDIKDLIAKMSMQSKYSKPPDNFQQPTSFDGGMGTDQSPHLMGGNNFRGGTDQSPLNPVNSVRPMGTPIGKVKPEIHNIANVTPTAPVGGLGGDVCPQCGTLHPPLAQGMKCPMAPVKVKNASGEEKIVDVNKFLTDLKNIIISQAEQRKIKDIEKLFKNIIVEVTKYIEGYSE